MPCATAEPAANGHRQLATLAVFSALLALWGCSDPEGTGIAIHPATECEDQLYGEAHDGYSGHLQNVSDLRASCSCTVIYEWGWIDPMGMPRLERWSGALDAGEAAAVIVGAGEVLGCGCDLGGDPARSWEWNGC